MPVEKCPSDQRLQKSELGPLEAALRDVAANEGVEIEIARLRFKPRHQVGGARDIGGFGEERDVVGDQIPVGLLEHVDEPAGKKEVIGVEDSYERLVAGSDASVARERRSGILPVGQDMDAARAVIRLSRDRGRLIGRSVVDHDDATHFRFAESRGDSGSDRCRGILGGDNDTNAPLHCLSDLK